MAGLNTGGQRPAGDNGQADPRLAAVLAGYAAGRESEAVMLSALAGARLLVPLLQAPAATPVEAADADGHRAEADHGHCDHQLAGEMAFPTLIGRDGRAALLAFTSLAALVSWRPDARPVPTPAAQVWGTAVADPGAVVIDVAGPVPVAVDGARLAALAAGEPPPEPCTDPDIRAGVAAALAGFPAISGLELAPGPDGTDLAVRLLIGPTPDARALITPAAEAIAARLAGRLRRGIEFSAAPARTGPATSAPAPSRSHG